jgi:hypothetical protein
VVLPVSFWIFYHHGHTLTNPQLGLSFTVLSHSALTSIVFRELKKKKKTSFLFIGIKELGKKKAWHTL